MNELFGIKHIILIVISIALIISLFFLSRKFQLKTIYKILFYTGIVTEFFKLFTYIIKNEEVYGGILPKTDLPLHLCSIQIIFFAILNFSKNENLKKFLLAFMFPSCLFGGIAAILIPTTSALNTWVITIQYFVYHICLVVFAIKLISSKEIKFTHKDYFNCLKFLVILLFASIYINSILYDGNKNINFMYVVSPPVSGLPYLNENNGWLSYIIKYAILIVVCVTLCYIKPIITAIKNSKRHFNKIQKESNTDKESNDKQ